jgi:hypothetical protein
VYHNTRLLADFDEFLLSKGLAGQYALVYGSALMAAQKQQPLPGRMVHVDMALSPTALQVLARNATREQLWRKGYVLWHDGGSLWRLCPHELHPAAAFRAAMVSNMTHAQWRKHTGQPSAVYLSGYLMWPRQNGPDSCSSSGSSGSGDGSGSGGGGGSSSGSYMGTAHTSGPEAAAAAAEAAAAAIMMQPLVLSASAAARAMHSPHDHWQLGAQLQLQQQGVGAALHQPTEQAYCLQGSSLAIDIRPGAREGNVSGRAFPVPRNLHE